MFDSPRSKCLCKPGGIRGGEQLVKITGKVRFSSLSTCKCSTRSQGCFQVKITGGQARPEPVATRVDGGLAERLVKTAMDNYGGIDIIVNDFSLRPNYQRQIQSAFTLAKRCSTSTKLPPVPCGRRW